MTKPCPVVLGFLALFLLLSMGSVVRAETALGHLDPNDGMIPVGTGELQELVARLGAAASAASDAGRLTTLSSAASLSYNSGEETGQNFGSAFVEAPWTLGDNIWAIGIHYAFLDFDEFFGEDLEDAFDEQHLGLFLDNDLDLRAHIVLLSVAYGLTDRLDIGVAVPLVSLSGEGDGYLGGMEFADYNETDTSLGDVVVRAKFCILDDEDPLGWSLGADVSLPTGDEDKWLGAGDAGFRLRTMLGKRFGRVYPSLELGYHWSGVQDDFDRVPYPDFDQDDFDAFEYRLSLPVEITSRWTASLDLIGQSSDFADQNDLGLSSRIGVTGNFLLRLGIRIPLDDDGLRADVYPTIGGEFRF